MALVLVYDQVDSIGSFSCKMVIYRLIGKTDVDVILDRCALLFVQISVFLLHHRAVLFLPLLVHPSIGKDVFPSFKERTKQFDPLLSDTLAHNAMLSKQLFQSLILVAKALVLFFQLSDDIHGIEDIIFHFPYPKSSIFRVIILTVALIGAFPLLLHE